MERMEKWLSPRFNAIRLAIAFIILFMLSLMLATVQPKIPQYFKQRFSQAPQHRIAYQQRAKLQKTSIYQKMTTVAAPDSLIMAGQLGGWMNSGAINGQHAFISQSTYLKVVDLAGPEMRCVASVPVLSEGGRNVR